MGVDGEEEVSNCRGDDGLVPRPRTWKTWKIRRGGFPRGAHVPVFSLYLRWTRARRHRACRYSSSTSQVLIYSCRGSRGGGGVRTIMEATEDAALALSDGMKATRRPFPKISPTVVSPTRPTRARNRRYEERRAVLRSRARRVSARCERWYVTLPRRLGPRICSFPTHCAVVPRQFKPSLTLTPSEIRECDRRAMEEKGAPFPTDGSSWIYCYRRWSWWKEGL